MTSACWATNKDFDCAMVHFGYGSRHDIRCYRICLKAFKAIALYDYEYISDGWPSLSKDDFDDRIIADQLGLEFHEKKYINIPKHLIDRLSLKKQMELSPIHIEHPNGLETSLQWFKEVKKCSGYFYNSGYEEKTVCHDYFGSRYHVSRLPSIKNIGKINREHQQYHVNLAFMDEQQNYNKFTYEGRVQRTDDQWDEYFDAMEKEIKNYKDGVAARAAECYKWL